MDKKEFLNYLLGEGSIAQLAAAIIFAVVGAFLCILLSTTKRDPLSNGSPVAFSWKYLWSDNQKKIYATIILIPLSLRFSRELFGSELTMYFALGIGVICDQLPVLIKKIRSAIIKD